jgi:metal-sulfur cluster biosynthetic enzyme
MPNQTYGSITVRFTIPAAHCPTPHTLEADVRDSLPEHAVIDHVYVRLTNMPGSEAQKKSA